MRWSWPADGSSRMRVPGRSASAMARASRFCWPNDRASGGRVRMSSRSCRAVRSRLSVDEGVEGRRISLQVARPEHQLLLAPSGRTASGSGSGRRSRTPSRARRCVDPGRIVPSTRMSPPVMPSSRIAVRNSVVLPEPLGPSTATTSSGPSRASTPWRISVVPMAARHAPELESGRGPVDRCRVVASVGRCRNGRIHAAALLRRLVPRTTSNGSLTDPRDRRSRGTHRRGRGSGSDPPRGTGRGPGGAPAPPRRGARR